LDSVLLHLIPFGIILAGAGGYVISVVGLRPLSRMAASARQIGADNISQRIPEQRDQELAELGGAFNQVLDRLEDSFESQKRFLADASHELRTPLAAIKVNTSVALSGAPSMEEYRAALECVDVAADRMSRLVNDLLFISRSEDCSEPRILEAVDVQQAVESVLGLLLPAAAAAGVELQNRVLNGLEVRGDTDLVERLLANLVSNSLAHTERGGHILVEGCLVGNMAELKVVDTGCGIPPEHLPRVFDRFYRVEGSRVSAAGGTGLGLSICKAIIESLGGSIQMESESGVGTTVSVLLPVP
jgi:two-component system heavy metal sensor histidine kinase CusS